jgi:hypothetical protein
MKGYDYNGKRYVCMVRASHASDELSTDAQLNMLHDSVRDKGMVFVNAIVLDGVTGSLPGKREDLQALLDRKKTINDFDVLVLQRLDRLTRGGAAHGLWFEHECNRVAIHLMFAGDDIPQGRYSNLIKVAKYDAAQEQAFSISQRSTQGAQFALEQGRNIISSRTPYGCWRLYLNSEGKPSHIIRDLRDGRQQKLHSETHEVIDTYGEIGGKGKGHYRKQKTEKVLLIPGTADEVAVVREIFHLHFVDGWGGKRIADVLNRRGIRSPWGKQWSQHQVEVIYEQEAYTGRSVGNRISNAIYHERNPNAPKQVDLDPAIHASAKKIPLRQRPREEWLIQEQPRMMDFLEPHVRQLAMAEQERLWARRGDSDRPKQSKSKHKASDYLFSGLLFARQDGEPLVGVLCGRADHRVRYYRHRRGRRGYLKGSIFNGMFHAPTLEKAVIEIVADILRDLPQLREQIVAAATIQSAALENKDGQLEDLQKRRNQLRKRTELIVSTLDEETLADAREELERLRAERRDLDCRIVAIETAQQTRNTDPNQIADAVVSQLSEWAVTLETLPPFTLRQLIGTLVQRINADMETKSVEVILSLPAWAFAQNGGNPAMRFVGNRPSSTSYETHHFHVNLGIADCRYSKNWRSVCCECRRRQAA